MFVVVTLWGTESDVVYCRRREEEARKKLLQNPIKMKHLQKLVRNNFIV